MAVTEPAPAGPLSDVVRVRVVALASQALGRIDQDRLPASLRRVASFAPARRARLAGTQVAAVLAHDDDFRERVAVQVRAALPDLARALDEGIAAPAADPVELAAVAYLLRPDGWADTVAAASQAVEDERSSVAVRDLEQRAERLRRQLESAIEELKEARRRHRDQFAEVKAENADLRRRLGETRGRVRGAEEVAVRASAELSAVVSTAAARAADQDAEIRRQRGRLEALERDLGAVRRTGRVGRDTETLRARLLLDTLLDTVQGLRRELVLPPVEGTPADLVEAHLADEAGHGSRGSSGHASLSSEDPALLDQLLALPRVHLVIDGYNVTKNAWPELSLERQRDRLVTALASLAARSGAEVTVVFDAAESTERPLVNRPRGVRVLFSRVGVIADDVIRELVAAEPQGRPVVVVSSDQEVVRDVVRAGARAAAAPALSRLLSRT